MWGLFLTVKFWFISSLVWDWLQINEFYKVNHNNIYVEKMYSYNYGTYVGNKEEEMEKDCSPWMHCWETNKCIWNGDDINPAVFISQTHLQKDDDRLQDIIIIRLAHDPHLKCDITEIPFQSF